MTRAPRLPAGLANLVAYRREWLGADLVAGIVLAAVVVPLGMAYSSLAGLTPISGLYASLVALLAYAAMGPSPVLVLGPDSSTAPLVAAVIIPIAGADWSARASLAALLAILVGVMALAIGAARLGFITDLLAKPVRVGYMNGVAAVIVVSQLPKLLGFTADGIGVVGRLAAFAERIDRTVPTAFAFGAVALLVLVFFRWRAPHVPVVLAVVAVAVAVSAWLRVADAGVPVVGMLPSGLPALRVPTVSAETAITMLAGAFGIAAITLADSSVLSESLASRFEYRADADREILSLGVANIAAGLFQGFPVSGSVTRTAVNLATGAKSQLAGIIAALLVGVMLVWAPSLLASLPLSVLAAVVIVAGAGMADVRGTVRLWHERRTEFVLSVAAFVAVVFLGVLDGVFVAITLSLLNFVRRQWRPHDAVLGRVPGVKGYHDITDFDDAQQIPGLLLYRFDAPLFFANARVFRERLYAHLDETPGTRRVVLVAEPLIDVDTTAADVLAEILRELRKQGIEVGFAGLKHTVRARLERAGVMELLDAELLYQTVGQAVHHYVADHGVDWVDWEEADECSPRD